MATKLRKLKIDRVDLVDKGANQAAHVMLFKRDETQEANMPPEKKEITQADMDELTARVEALMKDHDDALKRAEAAEGEVAKRDAAEKEAGEQDIWKNVHPEVRKQFEEQKAEITLAKAAAQLERDERVKQTSIQKAASYKYLPVNPDDDWEVFKAIDGLDTKVSSRIYELFSAGNTNLEKAIPTVERGSGGDGDVTRTAYDEINRLAASVVSKSSNTVDHNTAVQQVLRENPNLYKAYTREIRASVKGE